MKSGRSVGRLWRELILLYIWGGQQFVLAKYVQHCYLLPEEDVEPNRALLPVGCLSAPAGKTVYDFISGPFHSRCRRAPPPPPFPCCLFTSGPGAGLKNLNAEYIWRGKLIITRRQGWTKRDVVAGWLAIASSAGGMAGVYSLDEDLWNYYERRVDQILRRFVLLINMLIATDSENFVTAKREGTLLRRIITGAAIRHRGSSVRNHGNVA